MKKLIVPLLVILAVSFTDSSLLARKGKHREGHFKEGPHGHGGNGHRMFFGNPEMMKKELGLSDEQVDKISEINLDYKKKLLEIQKEISPKGITLQVMLLEDDVNLKNVRSLLREIADLKIEIRMLRIKQRLEIEKTLTRTQKTKLRNSRMKKGRMSPPPPPEMEP